MEIIQPSLGNNIYPIGMISSLSHPNRMLLRKESHFLNSRSNFISHIQTKPPLATSAKFFLSRKYESSTQPLIGWDSWDIQDINSEFPLLELDSFDSIAPPENNNINNSKSLKSSILEILPNHIDNHTSNDTSQEINIKDKSKSKKTNKSQQQSPKKSKPKSNNTKKVKSSATKNANQFVNENNIAINSNQDSLLATDMLMSVEANLEPPTLQPDIALDNSTNNNDFSSITPNIMASASPIVEDKSILFRNIANDSLQENFQITSNLPNVDSSAKERIIPSQEKIELDNTGELLENSPLEFPLPNNVEEIFTPSSNFAKDEQKIIPEAAESFNISDIAIKQTLSKPNVKIDQTISLVDNQTTALQRNLIQEKEISSTLNSPSQEEELPNNTNNNSNVEAIIAIEPDLILENTANDFVTDNAVVDNSVGLSPKLISADVDDKLHSVVSDENSLITNIAATNSESLVDLSPKLISADVDDKLHSVVSDENSLIPNIAATNSESLVDLSPKLISPNVDDKLHSVASDENSLITNITASNSESLVDLSPKLISPNVDDKLHSVASDENSLITNITASNSESLVDLSPKLISPDVENKLYSVANDENTLITNITASSSESLVAENPITVQQEIDSSFTSESPISTFVELTYTLVKIEDTPSLFRNSDNNEQLVTSESQSPAVNVSDVLANVTSLQRNSNVENTPSESTENQSILVLPEIVTETSLPTKSPEMGEAPLTTTSPEIIETASILRKIIDNEQTIELKSPSAVTNPEILTFVDSSDSPTSPQNEINTLAEVEQNATAKNLPAPKGYATGGHVTDSQVENRQQIAPSDTVPAMLTPGEFVINTRDAQKNLPLLHHINTGGTPQDIILPSLQTPNSQEPEEKISLETPTKVDSFSDTSLQLQSAETHLPQISNSLIPSSLGLNTEKHQLSSLNSPQLNTLQIDVSEPSPQYSSPPMIFRKANPTANTSSQWSNTPSQWSSVEDLLNLNNDEFTSFNFNGVESRDSQNSEFSDVSESPQIFAKHLPSPRGFANGGEVTLPDISREIEPITETIESASSSSQGGKKDDTADLEALAREIYNRLRQRIEIERERHGGSSGRLPW